jgi:hypothetical protein
MLDPRIHYPPSSGDDILARGRGKTMAELFDRLTFELCETLRYSSVTIFALVLAIVVVVSAFLLKFDKRRRAAWAVIFGLSLGALLISCLFLTDRVLRWSWSIGWPPSPKRLLRRLAGL